MTGRSNVDMDNTKAHKNALDGPWPSLAEEIQAIFGADWEIYREILSEGRHGDWIARRLRPVEGDETEIRATGVRSLAERLNAETRRTAMADAAFAQGCMDRLVAALQARGLQVAVRMPGLTARNPAVTSADPRGAALSPGLSQSVVLRRTGQGPAWHWIWPAPRRAGRPGPDEREPAPEIELICPAADIDTVAARVANVVRLREPGDG
jgi:hypothetical protein